MPCLVNRFSGSLQDILRRSSSYKKALIRAQSQPDIDDDSPVDCIPSYLLSFSGLVLTKNPVMMFKSHVLY